MTTIPWTDQNVHATPHDVVITLENPNAPFAVWPSPSFLFENPVAVGSSVPTPLASSNALASALARSSPAQPPSGSTVATTVANSPSAQPPSISVFASTVASPPPAPLPSNSVSASTVARSSPAQPPSKNEVASTATSPFSAPPPVTFKVSSHSLIQASPYFRVALTGAWKESSADAGGIRQISAEGWDILAFRIVLNVLHGRSKLIPRYVELETLCKIAVIVDYYEVHDALHFFAETWISALRGFLSKTYNRDAMMWTFVSWTFRDAQIYRDITKTVAEQCHEKPRTAGLPIPESTIDAIHDQRQAALDVIAQALGTVSNHLLLDIFGCSFECRCLILGALKKEMHKYGLEVTVVRSGISGVSGYTMGTNLKSFKTVQELVKHFQSPGNAKKNATGITISNHPPSCRVSLRSLLSPLIAPAKDKITGLELLDMKYTSTATPAKSS